MKYNGYHQVQKLAFKVKSTVPSAATLGFQSFVLSRFIMRA